VNKLFLRDNASFSTVYCLLYTVYFPSLSFAEKSTFLYVIRRSIFLNLPGMHMSITNPVNVASEEQEHHEQHLDKDSRELIDKLTKEVEALTDSEAKLNHVITFMESSLAQSGTPHFRCFWQARTLCLQLFKDHISPTARTALWQKYSELSKEARRLKSLLDEQSAFAVEQIEIAIKGLENEIAAFAEKKQTLGANSKLIEEMKPTILNSHSSLYASTQHELDHLNSYATRINGLRKELIKTEMRVRKKNGFFQRLSAAGDLVFPRRKELIKVISETFTQDIDAFIGHHFSQNENHDSLFALREEIKTLQNFAKILTLNTQAFTHTRMRLSECWDKLKLIDKERKKVRAEKRNVFKQNADIVVKQIEEILLGFQSGQRTPEEAQSNFDGVINAMRNMELGRDEIKELREKIAEARKPIYEKLQLAENERLEKDRSRTIQKQQKHLELQQEVHQLLKNVDHKDVDSLTSERDALVTKIQASSFDKKAKNELELMLKPLRDLIVEKKEQALMTLSDDDRQALQQLKLVLQNRKERKQQIKEQLEINRKASGASGLSFYDAIQLKEQINLDKERLDQLEQGIIEVTEKIKEHEQKVLSKQ